MNQGLEAKSKKRHGFTLMEILVATTIFATVVASMMALFNYTLKINRRSEALRQATQGMRNFVEFIAKEVRNGQIYYFISNGQTKDGNSLEPCHAPATVGSNSYADKDNKFAIVTPEGYVECFFLAYGQSNAANKVIGTPVADGVFGMVANDNARPALAMKKSTDPSVTEILTSPNISIQNLMFLVRPLCDSSSLCSGTYTGYPKIQPSVTILAKFLVILPTGEQTVVNYQTSVSSGKYDIAH